LDVTEKAKRYKLLTALFQFIKGTKPAFYAIIAVALFIYVCGCTGQTNTTIPATNAPSELPTVCCKWLKRSRHEHCTFGLARDGRSQHATPIPFVPLTVGTSFPCIQKTPDRTSFGVVTKVIDGDTIHAH
jgi:hypothetical protein